MPIYEYRCGRGHTFEVMQRMTDDPVVSCQTCAAPVERIFHPIAVHFKGSGFYNTDYGTRKRSRELKEAGEGTGKPGKDAKDAKDAKDSGPAKSDSDSKSSTKSESSGSSTATSSSSD